MNPEVILEQLTIDEKLKLLTGDGEWHTYDCNGKAPAIMMTDGPHGIRKVEEEKAGDTACAKPATCFPTASALACSFNPELAYKMAGAIADEAKNEGISIVLGCGTNIKRSPLCGRNFEYFSEDPYLSGKMATAYIKGAQDKNVGTSLKHFAGNSQETRRMTSNSQIDERALREIYLKAFEITVKEANPTTLMCCYNRVNGDFGSHNKHLLKEILREEWRYKGAVISDWGATIDVVKCFKNGLTLEMPDARGYHTQILKKAYEAGQITDEEIDLWALEVLTKLSALSDKVEPQYKADYRANEELAKTIECESAVLLKNEGALPVDKNKKLIIIGDLAKNMRFQGGGSSHINATAKPDAAKAFKAAGYDVTFALGYSNETDAVDEKLVSQALTIIKENYRKNDTKILFFLGLTEAFEGEGYDRTDILIPGNQTDLLERVAGVVAYEDLIAISFGGAPMDFSWDDKTSAVLHMYLGGQSVDKALTDLVSGKANPSGKLAESIPLVRTDVPGWRYFAPPHDDVEYRESIFVGYRYYETYKVPVKYPFGHGLSYTTFEYSDLRLDKQPVSGNVNVSFKVRNTGTATGKEVAQIYVCPNTPSVLRSAIELKNFAKIELEPGEEKEVTLTLSKDDFSIYDISKKAFSVISGEYRICVGDSVKNICLEDKIEVLGSEYFRDDRIELPEYFKEHPHGMDISEETFEKLYGRKTSRLRERKRGEFDGSCSFYDVSSNSLFGLCVRGIIGVAIKFMFPGKKADDPSMIMIRTGVYEGALEGLIATSGGVASPKLVEMLILAANRKHGQAILRLFRK